MAETAYYFDTSIWIDIYEKRGSNGEVAKRLMEKIILDDDHVLYSDAIIIELRKLGFSGYEIGQMVGIARPDHLQRAHTTRNQIEEAKSVAKQRDVPLRDALHAILARDHEAQLVSRDRDFEKLKDISRAKNPEELLQ